MNVLSAPRQAPPMGSWLEVALGAIPPDLSDAAGELPSLRAKVQGQIDGWRSTNSPADGG